MNGPEHYREAEQRLRASDYQRQRAGSVGSDDLSDAMHEAAVAQVHATLALAAVTALSVTENYFEVDADAQAWDDVAGVRPGDRS